MYLALSEFSHKKQNGLCSGSPLKRDTHSNLVFLSNENSPKCHKHGMYAHTHAQSPACSFIHSTFTVCQEEVSCTAT